MPDIPEQAIDAAWVAAGIEAAIAHHKQQRDTYWNCPSSGEVAAVISAVRPLVAAMAVQDAGLENDRMRAQLFALGAHLPAVLDALRLASADAEYGARAKRFTAALEALGGGETQQERSDGKGPQP